MFAISNRLIIDWNKIQWQYKFANYYFLLSVAVYIVLLEIITSHLKVDKFVNRLKITLHEQNDNEFRDIIIHSIIILGVSIRRNISYENNVGLAQLFTNKVYIFSRKDIRRNEVHGEIRWDGNTHMHER